MKRILVAYTTFSGSTSEVAQVIGEEIAKCGLQTKVIPAGEVKSLEGYDGVVVGGPMIMGWHRPAMGFLKKHRQALKRVPLAVFVTALSLTQTGDTNVDGVPVSVDEKLPKPPEKPGRLSIHERYSIPRNYLRPIIAAARPARPASIGLFGGKLEYGRLKWWAVLFVSLVIQAPAGDRRNWAAIRAWASGLPDALGLVSQVEAEPLPLTIP
jgi:menaquinone-dependent protoporphyrinogen oxidase